MGKLLIVGSLAFDSIETPFGKTEKTMGGAANYISIAASQFTTESAVVSVVGNDYPKDFLDTLESRNINISGVEVKPNGKTFFWSGKYHNDMNTRDTTETQLNVLLDFKPIVPKDFQQPDILMLGNLHPSVQLEVLSQMTQTPKLVVLDTMDYWMNHTWDLLMQVIKRVNIVTINDQEARQLSKEYSLVKAAQKIMQMGVDYVVIKKGEHGALLFHNESVFFAPALPLEEVFDPTGAGDTFAGGLVGYLAKTEDYSFENIKNAVIYGANLASFCVEKFGTERMLSLTKSEICNRLLQFKALTQFEIEIT
ncbi:PfkB family carbohydrate kinase [Capnocytophaga canimorsus]|uniref:PfkB family carbohydrate kinase n=1 Tax=Capnocytophaga canimorsus TaxID=28188 RepID=UPI001ACA74DD|nr:PfkB family carbohydrate kinase [Capnocytophaga canimorsus]GIM59150.1 sugar kinase [Capnocytophaga canimorsus]